jgi:hypothetical protein
MSVDTPAIVIVRDSDDPVASASPAGWAAEQFRGALLVGGLTAEVISASVPRPAQLCIVAGGPDSPLARSVADAAGVAVPTEPEALALVPATIDGRRFLLAAGADVRGLVYAILELADRVRHSADPLAALNLAGPIIERPANPIRGINRLLVSDVEDLAWFRDREGWRQYLTMIATHRFNRVHLALGIGHDFLRNVLDAYLLFPYPFLVDVPGYSVRAPGLSDAERAANLEMLRFISDETAARGLHFQLGIWTQAYQWVDSPHANYVIDGLTPENHAAYCRDAIRTVLDACPSIGGVTFRVHGESGVPEGNYDFWRDVFSSIADCGRPIQLDLHPKGVDRQMIDVGLATGLNVTISPKYTAEHMGLPGHQAEIRPNERDVAGREGDHFVEGLMNRSAFDLRYTRYGHADFLDEDRPYGVIYRIWPGTQRLLLWGDPALAAGYGRNGSFGGCLGVEVMEPLSFKGRRGSGLPGGRNAYADATLTPVHDWEKYTYTYRLFGRLLYDPDADPDQWRRELVHTFGPAAAPVEAALASASRILPLVTSAFHPSAANNRYWPEVYTSMPIFDGGRAHPYRDTLDPKRFGTVSPLDPGLFSRVDAAAEEIVSGQTNGKYSPLRVARWLDGLANDAARYRAAARTAAADQNAPAFRRVITDVAILAGLGRFFAGQLRAGVAFALYRRTGEGGRLRESLDAYRVSRAAWVDVVEHGKVYRDDITVGGEPWLRGHWADRLPAIDADLADIEAEWERIGRPDATALPLLADLDGPALDLSYTHTPPASFERGQPVEIELHIAGADPAPTVRLRYRHLNNAEAYVVVDMSQDRSAHRAAIPGPYTDSPYPLQYLFEIHAGPGRAWLYPGLAPDLANLAYYVIRRA